MIHIKHWAQTSSGYLSLDHEVMIKILGEKILDNRFLRMIRNMLTAGYLEDWRHHETLSGAPQGVVVSPILSNIYLDRLDVFVETVLIPQYTRGARRKPNPEYWRIHSRRWRARSCSAPSGFAVTELEEAPLGVSA
jgi:retron-type reverse transcriptase